MTDHIPDAGKMVSARDVLAASLWLIDREIAGAPLPHPSWETFRENDPETAMIYETQAGCHLAALSAAGWVVEQGWQPIETAPRDGNKWGPWVRLYQPGFVPLSGRWFHDSASRGWWVAAGRPFNPTHWRPIEPLPRRRTSDDGS